MTLMEEPINTDQILGQSRCWYQYRPALGINLFDQCISSRLRPFNRVTGERVNQDDTILGIPQDLDENVGVENYAHLIPLSSGSSHEGRPSHSK